MAASYSPSSSAPCRHLTASPPRLLQKPSLSREPTLLLRNPRRFRPLALASSSSSSSTSVQSPMASPSSPSLSFLDRKEQGLLHFVKYHGLGNDFIMVDNRDSIEPRITPEQAAKLCDRNFGIGADGVIFVMPATNGAHYTMRIFNSDGSEPEVLLHCFYSATRQDYTIKNRTPVQSTK